MKDNKWLSYYQYDAAGDRTYKLTGKGELQNINGEWRYFYHLDNATLYVSPYLVATKQGYTKHYYAETERIASRIGGGRLRYLDQPVVGQGKIVEKQSTNKTYAKEVLEECLDAIHSEGQADLHHLYDMINNAHSETDCYWYHPDHLGSSSWITDSAGTAVQHLHYLPWGEDFVDQRTSSFSSIYTFSAKEKDPETGLSYFGSRYYSSDLSVWLSVDPMASKYPSLSPYTYCADNPVKLVDPNGESISEFDENGNYIRTIKDNWFHNTFFGHSGRIVDSDGDVLKKFYFSDPKHDFEDIKNNVINKIQFVQESEINKMLSKAGAFDEDNKVFSSQGRYSYIQKEGKGGGKFDFSYTGIPFQYPEASRYPLDNPSHIMFLVDNVAYNHMNFGNFLYGAAGKALGLTLNELKIGAHYNSLFNSQSNNYKPQFDSRDDQKCIEMGVRYAKRHGYQNKFFHVVVGYVNNRF